MPTRKMELALLLRLHLSDLDQFVSMVTLPPPPPFHDGAAAAAAFVLFCWFALPECNQHILPGAVFFVKIMMLV